MGTSCCRGIEANWEYKREMGGKDEDEIYVYKYEYYLEKIFGIDNNCTLINDSWNIAWLIDFPGNAYILKMKLFFFF